jgi:hypothetical protein
MQLKKLKDFQFECGTKKFLHAIGKKMKQNLRCEYMWQRFLFFFKNIFILYFPQSCGFKYLAFFQKFSNIIEIYSF